MKTTPENVVKVLPASKFPPFDLHNFLSPRNSMASSVALESEYALEQARFKIVVASPNPQLRRRIEQKLVLGRWSVVEAGCGARMTELFRQHEASECVLLLDPTLPDLDPHGFDALIAHGFPLAQALVLNPQTGQLLMGAEASPVAAELVRAMNCRPALPSRESRHFSMDTGVRYGRDVNRLKLRGMIGSAASMQYLWNVARRVAALKTTILITGESGTGKDLLAQEIHLISQRRNEPFVIVNCSEISENSLEADLFGYAKGAFTGAVESRIGRIHAAQGGTLFLDQIGAMPLSLQGKILRFLDQGEVQRLGGKGRLKVDVRVIAASEVDLKDQVAKQRFREDLYYRLAVFPLNLPPLRDRMSDLEDLAKCFVAQILPRGFMSSEALDILSQHNWLGNVRELRKIIQRAATLVGRDREIRSEHVCF